MAPLKVTIVWSTTSKLDLILPFDDSLTFSHLITAASDRAKRYTTNPTDLRPDSCELRLNTEDGFLIDSEDVVSDILRPADIMIIRYLRDAPNPVIPPRTTSYVQKNTLQIRVITPDLAHKHRDLSNIPLLKNGYEFPLSTSLSQIRRDIASSLGMNNYESPTHQSAECNCALAEHISRRGIWEKITCSHHIIGRCCFDGVDGLCAQCNQDLAEHRNQSPNVTGCGNTVLVRRDLDCGHAVHSNCVTADKDNWCCPKSCTGNTARSKLATSTMVIHSHGLSQDIDVVLKTRDGIMQALEGSFGHDIVTSKSVQMLGGHQVAGIYERLPFIAICAKDHSRHNGTIDQPRAKIIGNGLATLSVNVLDLHTTEGPIETHNPNLTIENVRLDKLAIDGILYIFAVHWLSDGTQSLGIGKDALFKAAPCWTLPVAQTDRGMAAVLSCLRVLAHVTTQADFEDVEQNEVLRQMHMMTRFVPAVRALHILMSGKTLLPSACAALVQTLAVACRTIIPHHLIQNNEKRFLEGCRLLIGGMLHLAKAARKRYESRDTTTDAAAPLVYLTAFHTVDLKDVVTREAVQDPVQVAFGLVERSIYTALSNGGPFGYTPDDKVGNVCIDADPQVLRVALLYGGVSDEVQYYETDALTQSYLVSMQHSGETTEIEELSKDIKYFAMLSEDTRMAVSKPANLFSAQPPCLTLDRDGHLAVYTGQAACAPPDKDKSFYRPIAGREEQTDVSIVTQKLAPILVERERDGTIVFDIFSASFRRKETRPTEILMLCVDCSYSMKRPSDFEELHDTDTDDNEDGSGNASKSSETEKDFLLEDLQESDESFQQIKNWISQHESFEDMLVIIRSQGNFRTRARATEVIQYLRRLTSRQIAHVADQAAKTKRWATSETARFRSKRKEDRFAELRSTLTALHIHESALCDFLIFKAQDPAFQPAAFEWNYGDPVPTQPVSTETSQVVDVSEWCTTPDEFICPIKSAVFEDPVTTSDGFTFERRAIERWFRIRQSSPLTGLMLPDTSLSRNQPLADRIKKWIEGEGIVDTTPTLRRLRSLNRNHLTINFIAPTGAFSRKLPTSATLADLHKTAYRGMRGVYNRFTLHCDGQTLLSSSTNLFQQGIKTASDVIVRLITDNVGEQQAPAGNNREMVLIRVYTGGRTSSYPVMCYWVPRNTPVTVASIMFKYWRTYPSATDDKDVWHNLQDAGDGRLTGTNHRSWQPLADIIELARQMEVIQRDPLCQSLLEAIRGPAISQKGWHWTEDKKSKYDSTYRVVKVNLYTYKAIRDSTRRDKKQERLLTRMGVSKQVFGAFINRLIAYNYNIAVGLVTFGTTAIVSQPVTEVVENFRTAVDRMNTAGDTALWDSISLAIDQMNEYGEKHPGIKKRIFCLTDGNDTSSNSNVNDIARIAMQHKVVIDSCTIGEEHVHDLRKLSQLTGGYKFKPQTLEEAVTICELEPVLSLDERPNPVVSTSSGRNVSTILRSMAPRPDRATRDQIPSRKSHVNLTDSFIHISNCRARKMPEGNTTNNPSSLIRTRRILNEIRDIAALPPHPSYDIYVSESNMSFWKIVMSGPPESAYTEGTFVMYLDMDETYPINAPKGRFVTPIFHPNINRHGKICHSIFDRNWTVDTSNKQILDTVYGLLLVPEFTDPVNTIVTLNYYWDEVAFRAEVLKHIEIHAKKGREEWRKEIDQGC